MQLCSEGLPVSVLVPASYPIGVSRSSAIDMAGCKELDVLLHCGAFSSGTVTVKIAESDGTVAASAADITGAAFPAIASASDSGISIGRVNWGPGRKRYGFAVATVATGPNLFSVEAIKSKSGDLPAVADADLEFDI